MKCPKMHWHLVSMWIGGPQHSAWDTIGHSHHFAATEIHWIITREPQPFDAKVHQFIAANWAAGGNGPWFESNLELKVIGHWYRGPSERRAIVIKGRDNWEHCTAALCYLLSSPGPKSLVPTPKHTPLLDAWWAKQDSGGQWEEGHGVINHGQESHLFKSIRKT